jgi:agmatinase
MEESFDVITEDMTPLFENGITPIAMGGDHSVTLPELRACHKTHGPVALIHFDAHYDTIPEYFGKPYTHGTPFYHAAKEGLVDTSKSIQVGIREGLYGPEDLENSKGLGYDVLLAVEAHKMSTEEIIKRIKDRVGDSKAFLTFDIDFIDPAYAPGTGTPVLGGFSTTQALEIIRGLKELNIIGYDLVEVAPQYDPTSVTSIAAAGVMYEFISHIAYKKKHNITF